MRILIEGKQVNPENAPNLHFGVDKCGTQYIENVDDVESNKERTKLMKSLQRSRY